MNIQRQEALLRTCYLLDAWSCFDVAVLMLVIASFEFGQMAEWLVYQGELASPCRLLSDLTQRECFQVELSTRSTIAVLIPAGLALLVVPKLAMRFSAHAMYAEFACQKVSDKALPQPGDA